MDSLKKVIEFKQDILDFINRSIRQQALKETYTAILDTKNWETIMERYSVSEYLGKFGELKGSAFNNVLKDEGYELFEPDASNRKNFSNIHKYIRAYLKDQKFTDFEIINLSEKKADSLLVIVSGVTILVDSGTNENVLRKQLASVPKIDMIIVTHCDSDHIAGIVNLATTSKFQDSVIVYNRVTSGYISYNQAEKFEKLTKNRQMINSFGPMRNYLDQVIFLSSKQRKLLPCLEDSKIYITFLAPDKKGALAVHEDFSKWKKSGKKSGKLINKHSIVFLLEFNKKKALFTGDATIADFFDILVDLSENSHEKIETITCLKIPHHGAVDNNSQIKELVEKFFCKKMILTNTSANISKKNCIHPYISEQIDEGEYKFYVKENQKKIPYLSTKNIRL